jgi:murein endopeptidase
VAHAYGTRRTVNLLKAAVADVKARWPDAPDLVIGHLSYKRGGHMHPHKSHQSGRDADGSFYYKGNVQLQNFHEMTPETFDAVKNWHLFKTLIDTGEVEYIFVRHDLQKVLYEYARSIGYTKKELAEIIQYPRPTHERVGIIRHTGGHDDHFHIRFKCRDDDKHCR